MSECFAYSVVVIILTLSLVVGIHILLYIRFSRLAKERFEKEEAGVAGENNSENPTGLPPIPPPIVLSETQTSIMPTPCANEGGMCEFNGTALVSFGSGSKALYKAATGGVMCNVATFGGDPIKGRKSCSYQTLVPMKKPDDTKLPCAKEGNVCKFEGTAAVAYGSEGKYNYKVATNSILCNAKTFGGDPNYRKAKFCHYEIIAPPNGVIPAIPIPKTLSPYPDGVLCAEEKGNCDFKGKATVAYGANGKFVTKEFTNGVNCNYKIFGDPIKGVAKSCYIKNDTQPIPVIATPVQTSEKTESVSPSPVPTTQPVTPTISVPANPNGILCATEGKKCDFVGDATVAYGAEGKFKYKEAKNGIMCSVKTFGDPIKGKAKSCYYKSKSQSGGGRFFKADTPYM